MQTDCGAGVVGRTALGLLAYLQLQQGHGELWDPSIQLISSTQVLLMKGLILTTPLRTGVSMGRKDPGLVSETLSWRAEISEQAVKKSKTLPDRQHHHLEL